MAPADVEWVVGVVRAGRDYQGMENAKAGGPGYEFTATIIVRGGTAEIVGGAGRLTPALAKEIEIALYSQGITTAIWERFQGDPKKLVRATRGRTPQRHEGKSEHSEALYLEPEGWMQAQEQEPYAEATVEAHSIRNRHANFQNLESLGFSAVRFGLNGHAHDQSGACCHRPPTARATQMTMTHRQKAVSR